MSWKCFKQMQNVYFNKSCTVGYAFWLLLSLVDTKNLDSACPRVKPGVVNMYSQVTNYFLQVNK